MSVFLAIAAILAWLFGGTLIFAPQQFYAPVGIAMSPLFATVAQAHGATLIGVGLVNWLGCAADRRGQIAILADNLLTQLASMAIAARTIALGAGVSMAPAIVIHASLGCGCALFLWRTMRPAPIAQK